MIVMPTSRAAMAKPWVLRTDLCLAIDCAAIACLRGYLHVRDAASDIIEMLDFVTRGRRSLTITEVPRVLDDIGRTGDSRLERVRNPAVLRGAFGCGDRHCERGSGIHHDRRAGRGSFTVDIGGGSNGCIRGGAGA